MSPITTILDRRQSYDLTALIKYPYVAFQARARTVYYWPKNGFKDRPHTGILSELSNRTTVDLSDIVLISSSRKPWLSI